MGGITVHYTPGIPWHAQRIDAMRSGLKALGFRVEITSSRKRINDDPAVLFGTSGFRSVEQAPGDWLLVDRACWGDPDWVRLGWNGHGCKADYKLPEERSPRWIPKLEPIEPGERVIICGDYGGAPADYFVTPGQDVYFKPHPRDPKNYTRYPVTDSLDDCLYAVCGASTIAVELQLRGVDVRVTDDHSMALMTLEEISWTQFSWDEIAAGDPIGHLFRWLRSSKARGSSRSSSKNSA